MADHQFTGKKVEPIEVNKSKSISQLLSDMSKTGFQGKKLAEATELYRKMLTDPDITIFLGYSGSLSVAGQWKLIRWLIEQRFIDVLVPTGANISEDIVEAMGFAYYRGSSRTNDEELFTAGINRYYDVYGKEKDYLEMTELIAEFILTLDESYNYSSREFLYIFGKWLAARGVNSIVSAAAENNIPVFCPAIADSAFGDAALIAKSRGFTLTIDAIKDYIEFMGLAEGIKETGVFYIGGGVPKDFIQLFAVTSDLLYTDMKIPNRDNARTRYGTDESYYPHKYAVQITTDSPQWGGLSGCTFEEAVSWGKETTTGRYVQCYCDATIALPIMTQSIAENINGKRSGTDFSFLYK